MTHTADMGGTGFLQTLSDELASAVERVGGSVVRVDARRGGAASGTVWSSSGHILTADHAIEREEDITVHLADDQALRAALIARDARSDLALLRVDSTNPTPAERAPEGSLRVGGLVMAIGRPGPSGPVATIGIISALGGAWRTARGGQLESYVRSDAALYPGFSGGPLVDAAGRVVGINSWTLSQGAGLALPVAVVSQVAESLERGGVKRAFLGVGTQVVPIAPRVREHVNSQETGLIVLSLAPAGPADTAGLLIGDVIVSMDDHPLADADDLQSQLTPERVGSPTRLRIISGGQVKEMTVTLGQRD